VISIFLVVFSPSKYKYMPHADSLWSGLLFIGYCVEQSYCHVALCYLAFVVVDLQNAGAGYSLPTSNHAPFATSLFLGIGQCTLCLDELVTCHGFSYSIRIFLGNYGANSVTRKQLWSTSDRCSENYSKWFGQNQGSGSSSYTERLSLWYIFFPVAFVSTFDVN
jgi:hypothetical protein